MKDRNVRTGTQEYHTVAQNTIEVGRARCSGTAGTRGNIWADAGWGLNILDSTTTSVECQHPKVAVGGGTGQ